jgi:hypothetical protein
VECLVDSMNAGESLEDELVRKGYWMASDWSLGSMEMYPGVGEGAGSVDSVALAANMGSETDFGRLGTGFGFGTLAADWAGLPMGSRCYSKSYLRY